MIYSYRGRLPVLGEQAFVAPGATVIGDVTLGERSSVWYGAVVRGDVNTITIGPETNLQDGSVVHVTTDRHPTVIGSQVTVGHGAIVHGCTVGDRCLIGMGAVLLDGVVLGEECLVAAGALVPPGRAFPPGSLIVGSPAKLKAPLTDEEVAWIRRSAAHYVELARIHRLEVHPV